LNRPGELRGGVLELIRAHRDRLKMARDEVGAISHDRVGSQQTR
jgi:hypothetical protein